MGIKDFFLCRMLLGKKSKENISNAGNEAPQPSTSHNERNAEPKPAKHGPELSRRGSKVTGGPAPSTTDKLGIYEMQVEHIHRANPGNPFLDDAENGRQPGRTKPEAAMSPAPVKFRPVDSLAVGVPVYSNINYVTVKTQHVRPINPDLHKVKIPVDTISSSNKSHISEEREDEEAATSSVDETVVLAGQQSRTVGARQQAAVEKVVAEELASAHERISEHSVFREPVQAAGGQDEPVSNDLRENDGHELARRESSQNLTAVTSPAPARTAPKSGGISALTTAPVTVGQILHLREQLRNVGEANDVENDGGVNGRRGGGACAPVQQSVAASSEEDAGVTMMFLSNMPLD